MAVKIEIDSTLIAPKKTSVYTEHLKSTPIKATTTIQKTHGKVAGPIESKEQQLHSGVMIPDSQLVLLTVEGSHTINLGNYESARIGAMLRVPTTKDELDSAYTWCTQWISGKLDAAIADAKGET
jgi:hypothetical protein